MEDISRSLRHKISQLSTKFKEELNLFKEARQQLCLRKISRRFRATKEIKMQLISKSIKINFRKGELVTLQSSSKKLLQDSSHLLSLRSHQLLSLTRLASSQGSHVTSTMPPMTQLTQMSHRPQIFSRLPISLPRNNFCLASSLEPSPRRLTVNSLKMWATRMTKKCVINATGDSQRAMSKRTLTGSVASTRRAESGSMDSASAWLIQRWRK